MTHSMNGTAPRHKFLPRLSGVVENGQGRWKACCPIHEADGQSHSPSLEITEKPDGTLLLHCFPCGPDVTAARFVHAVGLTMSDLYADHGKRPGRKDSLGKKVADYVYRDAQGCIAYRAERWMNGDGTKTFTQSRPNGQGGWVPGVKGIERVPYRLPELIASAADGATVFIVEGEKKVEALVKWGLVATCNVGGAGKWNKEFSTRWLRDRDVVILPDNDPLDPETGRSPGFDHAAKVLECTKPVAKSVRVIELSGLPPKGDIVDWIDQGGTLPKLMELLKPSNSSSATAATAKIEAIAQKQQEATAVVAEMDPLDLRIKESRNDDGNGRRFVKAANNNARFCNPWGAWLVFDGGRWRTDDSLEVIRTMKGVSRGLWREMATFGNDVSPDVFAKVTAFARSSCSMSGINRAIEAAQSELTILPREMDSDPWLLNCKNGTVDLRTGEMRPHDPADLITKISPVEFDPDATCPEWLKFVGSLFESPDLRGYVQRLCGYWSTGIVREQMLPILWGTGSNGKSTFLEVLMNVLGEDYTMMAPPGFVMAKMHDTHPTELADLFGKRFVLASETEEGKRLNEAMVKSLTGSDKIRARRMRENFWEFDPTHKIALVTNHQPIISGTDKGIWRRIRMVPFLKKFWNPDIGETGPEELRQVKGLGERLMAESSGILTWIIRGCVEWLHDGECAPKEVLDLTNTYQSAQDVFKAFLEECCTLDSSAVVSSGDLYGSFKAWSKANNEWAGSARRFSQLMSDRGFQKYKNSGTFWQGLMLQSDGSGFA